MNALRAILALALVVHPLLLRALPCSPIAIPGQAAACCEASCCCAGGCECALDEPADPSPAPPAPALTQSAGDLRASLPGGGGVIAVLPAAPPPPAPAPATDGRAHTSCASVNALHCIWTT
jgi:hypothetical protein